MTLSEFYAKWHTAPQFPISEEAIFKLLEKYGYYADIVDEILEDLRLIDEERRKDRQQLAA